MIIVDPLPTNMDHYLQIWNEFSFIGIDPIHDWAQ